MRRVLIGNKVNLQKYVIALGEVITGNLITLPVHAGQGLSDSCTNLKLLAISAIIVHNYVMCSWWLETYIARSTIGNVIKLITSVVSLIGIATIRCLVIVLAATVLRSLPLLYSPVRLLQLNIHFFSFCHFGRLFFARHKWDILNPLLEL